MSKYNNFNVNNINGIKLNKNYGYFLILQLKVFSISFLIEKVYDLRWEDQQLHSAY